jgi:hypothetical protein
MTTTATMVAVTTLRDAAGAEVTREVIADHGIPVEVRRVGSDPYFGSGTNEAFEVRVPEERVAEVHALLDGLEADLARAALQEAGVPPGELDAAGDSELPPPERRPRKPAWAVALALVGPWPGVGCLYARAFALGWTMAGMTVAFLAAGVLFADATWMTVVLALKVADVILAPLLAARFNRHLATTMGASRALDA